MQSRLFQTYTANLSRILMAEFIDDLRHGRHPLDSGAKSAVRIGLADIAHLVPPFPAPPAQAGNGEA